MKVWLDDRRPPPDETWTWVRTPAQAIDLLRGGNVTDLSLDHDLGLFTQDGELTGYDVVVWLEQEVACGRLGPPRHMDVHSANVSARRRMELGFESIRRLADRKRRDP